MQISSGIKQPILVPVNEAEMGLLLIVNFDIIVSNFNLEIVHFCQKYFNFSKMFESRHTCGTLSVELFKFKFKFKFIFIVSTPYGILQYWCNLCNVHLVQVHT